MRVFVLDVGTVTTIAVLAAVAIGLLITTPGVVFETHAILAVTQCRGPQVVSWSWWDLGRLTFDLRIPRLLGLTAGRYPPEQLAAVRALPLRKRIVDRYVPCWAFNAFLRHYEDGQWNWGFGLLQLGGRHLVYAGGSTEEGWDLDILFVHVAHIRGRCC